MSLLIYLKSNAKSKGIYACSACGTEDIFFSLNDKCDNCGNTIPQKPKLLKLQFSIEVLLYFINNYDESFPRDQTRQLYINGGQKVIEILEETNASSLSKDEFSKFQYVTKLIPELGGNKLGGLIKFNPPSLQMLESCPNPVTVGKSLASIYWSIEYINNFKI